MTVRWPVSVLPPRRVSFDIAPRTLAAPANIYGVGQVVSQDAGIWRATFGDIYVRGRFPVVMFRGIATELEGRLGKIIVPLCRSYQPASLEAIEGGILTAVPHSDETFFSDDAGYVGETVSVVLVGAVAARATAMSVNIVFGGTLMPGHHFSVGDRLYRIKTVTYTSGTTANITVRPPVREAIADGTSLDFEQPVCRMRLATDTEMDLELALRREGNPTVNFIEDI